MCDVPLIFGELCRMIDYYVGNEYIFIDRRFSEYCQPVKNYEFPMKKRLLYTRFAWAGGTFVCFQLCCCEFFFLAVNRFWFYILLMYLEYHKVVVFC